MTNSTHLIQEVYDFISEGFVWENTPQGFEYWHDVLASLLDVGAEMGESKVIRAPLTPDPDECYNIIRKLDRSMDFNFTPQGFKYWFEVCENLRGFIPHTNDNTTDDYDRAMKGV